MLLKQCLAYTGEEGLFSLAAGDLTYSRILLVLVGYVNRF